MSKKTQTDGHINLAHIDEESAKLRILCGGSDW